jgi:hypothetical protein
MREIAFKAPIKTLLSGEYAPSAGEFEAAYVKVGSRRISRCNVIGTIVRDGVLDDGTAEIRVTRFEEPLGAKEGDIVRVIGKIRQKGDERFIAVEALQQVDGAWLELRKLELERQSDDIEEEAKEITVEQKKEAETDYIDIEELDA